MTSLFVMRSRMQHDQTLSLFVKGDLARLFTALAKEDSITCDFHAGLKIQ